MHPVDEAIDFIYNRSLETKEVMTQLSAPPNSWQWEGESSGTLGARIIALDDQIPVLSDAEALTSTAAAGWDHEIDLLLADAVFGAALARVKWKNDPVRLQLFQGLRHGNCGRDEAYKQALDFESSWKAADVAWVFQTGLTHALFQQRRKALRTREENHVEASKIEARERAYLHEIANGLNDVAVDWYEVATATFKEGTVPGDLIRTIPTTYDPNQPPGRLVFTEFMSPAPNQVHLKFKAPRGEKFTLRGKGPGQATFLNIAENLTDKEWMGLGMSAGLWNFEGFSTNAFGQGTTSLIVQVEVAATAVA